MHTRPLGVGLVGCLLLAPCPAQDAAKLARDYEKAIVAVNEAHADKPVARDERELHKRLPAAATKLPKVLAELADAPDVRDALAVAAAAALDLDRIDDFELLQKRLAALDPPRAQQVGIAVSRPRFVAIGTQGMQTEGLTAVADVFDLVLDAYRDVFGLEAFSKVPGKKLRLRVHLEPKIERPPHFAPQFPFHSEIDFPVVDAAKFASPTKEGQFLFYGLCHELGHVVAMWGDRKNEEDRHAWAHYTGVAIVEHLAAKKLPALQDLRDVRWRSLEFERKRLAAKKVVPGPVDADTVLARFLALHDAVGAKTIGEALAGLDARGKHERINRVRYYAMQDLHAAIVATKAGKAAKKAVDAAFAGS
ncbi:MAG: hypothetical protein JNK15_24620 [Planctomycetes bacterium]|nr:hypothetical protein [Planctomycetota bacterium]